MFQVSLWGLSQIRVNMMKQRKLEEIGKNLCHENRLRHGLLIYDGNSKDLIFLINTSVIIELIPKLISMLNNININVFSKFLSVYAALS